MLAAALLSGAVGARAQSRASCSADGRTWDDTCSGGRSSGGYTPVNPNEEAAWAYNSIGNQAYNAGRYDEAVENYERALQRIENAVIRQNLRNAQVRLLSDRADIEWKKRNWKAVIELLTQAFDVNHDQWVNRNLIEARAQQYGDWATEAYEKKNFKEAILFWEEAYRLRPAPEFRSNIELARRALSGKQIETAYKSGDYAGAIAAARQLLRADPNDEGAALWLAEASLERPAASYASYKDLQAQLDEGVQALLRITRNRPDDQKLANSLQRVRVQALGVLVGYTREKSVPDGYDRAVQSAERWGISHDGALSFLRRMTGEALAMGTWGPAISSQDAEAAGSAASVAGNGAPGAAAANVARARRDAVIAAATGQAGAEALIEQARRALSEEALSVGARKDFESLSPSFKFDKTEMPRPSLPELSRTLRSAEAELEAIPNPDTIRDLAKRSDAEQKKEEVASRIKVLKKRIYVLTGGDENPTEGDKKN